MHAFECRLPKSRPSFLHCQFSVACPAGRGRFGRAKARGTEQQTTPQRSHATKRRHQPRKPVKVKRWKNKSQHRKQRQCWKIKNADPLPGSKKAASCICTRLDANMQIERSLCFRKRWVRFNGPALLAPSVFMNEGHFWGVFLP